MIRRRRPVLGTVARTAVVASTAQATAGRVHRKQQQRWAAEDAAAANAAAAQAAAAQAHLPPPPAPPVAPAAPAAPAEVSMDDKLAQLAQLGALRDQGILTNEEFEAKKTLILGS